MCGRTCSSSSENNKTEIKLDITLGTVFCYTRDGWPNKISDHLKPNAVRANELSIGSNLLMWC